MSLLVCDGVGIAFGATTVLSGLDLRLEERDRLAVVGANGSGKSSLLDILAGVTEPAAGAVERARRLRVAYLPQEAPQPRAATVLGEALASREDIARLRAQLEVLEHEMAAPGPGLEAAMARYGEAQHAYEALGGYDLEARARAALGGVGLDEDTQRRHPAELSGGQVRRLELAKLLLQDADVVLIDEPTNHLDLEAIEWVEGHLRETPEALVLVSHDRRFLDRVCNRVLELSHGVAEEYPGSYSQYVRLRAERRERRRREFEAQQAHIAHQEDFIRRYRAGQRAKEARGRQKQLDRLDRVAAPAEEVRPRLRFATTPGAAVLLRATDLVAGRDGVPLVHLGRTVVAPGDRVAIVGPNGSGKSTLLHTLAGELPPVEGTVSPGARLRARLYRQDLAALDDSHTVLEELLAEHPIGEERGRTLLGALLFEGDDVFTRVADLSGGERARLALGRLALEPTNLLLLDEPTNHLDIPAQEVLEAALSGYAGGVVMVSHDRALIDAVATRVWAIEQGRIREVLGGYSDLLRARERERLGLAPEPPPVPSRRARDGRNRAGRPDASTAPAPRRAAPRPAPARTGGGADDRRRRASDRETRRVHGAEVRRLEAEIEAVEDDLARTRQRLLDPATFADPAQGAEAGREHERLAARLAELYEQWTQAAG